MKRLSLIALLFLTSCQTSKVIHKPEPLPPVPPEAPMIITKPLVKESFAELPGFRFTSLNYSNGLATLSWKEGLSPYRLWTAPNISGPWMISGDATLRSNKTVAAASRAFFRGQQQAKTFHLATNAATQPRGTWDEVEAMPADYIEIAEIKRISKATQPTQAEWDAAPIYQSLGTVGTPYPANLRNFTDTTVPNPGLWYQLTRRLHNGGTLAPEVGGLVAQNQPGSVVWNKFIKNLDDYKNTYGQVVALAPGFVYVAGYFEPSENGASFLPPNGQVAISAGAADIFLAKYTDNGVLVWRKYWGGALDDKPYGLAIDRGGNIIMVGQYNTASLNFGGGNLPYAGPAGVGDVFIVKFDSDGNHLWSHGYGGTSQDTGIAVAADSSDNIWLGVNLGFPSVDFGGTAGTVSGIGSANSTIVKFNSSGTALYARRISQASGEFGDANTMQSLAVDGDDNVIIGGYFTGNPNFGGGSRAAGSASGDLYMAKYSVGGVWTWDRHWTATGFCAVYGLAIDRNDPGNPNSIIITGPFSGRATTMGNGSDVTTPGGTAMHITRYTKDNVYIRHNLYGGNPSQSDLGNAVSISADGKIAVVATIQSILTFGGKFYFGDGAANYVVCVMLRDGTETWASRVNNPRGRGIAADQLRIYTTGGTPFPVDFGAGQEPAGTHPGVHGFTASYYQ